MKLEKIFECLCPNGFTGVFCEFKADQNQLLYLEDRRNALVFNDEAQLLKSLTLDDDVGTDESCFTMLNGEAVLFGRDYDSTSVSSFDERQVTISNYKLF